MQGHNKWYRGHNKWFISWCWVNCGHGLTKLKQEYKLVQCGHKLISCGIKFLICGHNIYFSSTCHVQDRAEHLWRKILWHEHPLHCSQVLLKDTEDSKKTLEEELQKTAEVKPGESQINFFSVTNLKCLKIWHPSIKRHESWFNTSTLCDAQFTSLYLCIPNIYYHNMSIWAFKTFIHPSICVFPYFRVWMKQKATATVEENKCLKSKLQVAEAVQRQTNSAEQDYEEVIQLLEAEIKDLKNQLAGKKQRGLEATKVNVPLSSHLSVCWRIIHIICKKFTRWCNDWKLFGMSCQVIVI